MLAVLLSSCGGKPFAKAPARPPETFDWVGQSITFTPPPDSWRREGYGDGGWLGAWFVKERSVGERILVADYRLVAERDNRAEIAEIVEKFDTFDERGFRKALGNVQRRTDDPLSPLEGDISRRVNESLRASLMAFLNDDASGARWELRAAVRESERLQLTLGDVLDRVEFRPERRQEPARWQLLERRTGELAGYPAVFIDYTFQSPERLYHCRDVYWMRENHLFTASFLGLKASLPVFDEVVASIQFPKTVASR